MTYLDNMYRVISQRSRNILGEYKGTLHLSVSILMPMQNIKCKVHMADHLPCLCFSNSTCSDEERENTTKYELARTQIIQQTKCKVHIK